MTAGPGAPARSGTTECEVPVRWRDLDPLGHVSHIAFHEYFEEARNELLTGRGLALDEYVIASSTVNFRREIPRGTPFVTARSRVAQVGRSSLTMAEEVVGPHGEPLADATTVIVLWDPARRRSRRITAAERAAFDGAPA